MNNVLYTREFSRRRRHETDSFSEIANGHNIAYSHLSGRKKIPFRFANVVISHDNLLSYILAWYHVISTFCAMIERR